MANLKNNTLKKNSHLLLLAFEQAKINLGSTKTNPSVGCIIEKDGSVISSGHTSLNGRPHGEFNALNKRINFKKANLFVTLEPCSHYGLTPPCTKLIIKKKINKVFFSSKDKDLRSRNKSKDILIKKNIFVKSNFLKEIGDYFYQSYFMQHSNSLPYIDAKIAISSDYFTINKKKKWITNLHSRKRAQYLRTMYNCIVSTSRSINKDNSLLNCRLEGLENKSPDLVIVDRNLKIKKNLKLYNIKSHRRIILFTCKNNKKKISFLKKRGIKVFFLKRLLQKVDFINFFQILKKRGYSRIFVESGLLFTNLLIKYKLIQNIYIFKSSKKLKYNGKNETNISILKKIKLKNKINVNLIGDKLFKEKII